MITQELKIGDQVVYDNNPTKWGGIVIGFRGDEGSIAILDSLMNDYIVAHPNPMKVGKTNQEFIWKFNVDGKGIITYNNMWSVIKD